jgi:hypothetical protein
MDAARAGRAPHVLGCVDAHAQGQALHRIRAARGDRDVREVALAMAPRQAKRVVWLRIVLAGHDARDRVDHPPLADLDDEREVPAVGGVADREAPHLVGGRCRTRSGQEAGARPARHAFRKRGQRHRHARDVDGDVVEGIDVRRVVDRSADGRRSAVRARGLAGARRGRAGFACAGCAGRGTAGGGGRRIRRRRRWLARGLQAAVPASKARAQARMAG